MDTINKIISLLPRNDIDRIDWLYIIPKKRKVEIFRGFNIPYDPYYLRRGKNGKPTIVISIESIQARNKNRLQRYVLKIIILIFLIVIILPIIIWCIKDKNIKFWYLMGENRVKYKNGKNVIERELFQLINYLLFYIGIHKAFDIFSSDEFYLNINMYEFATKYRDSKIDYVIENMKDQPLAIRGSWQ